MKKLIKIICVLAALLISAALLTVTLSDSGFLPSFLPYGAYHVTTDAFAGGGLLPEDSLAIVDRQRQAERGDLVFFGSEGYEMPGVVVEEGEKLTVSDGEGERTIDKKLIYGVIFYRVERLGLGLSWINACRYFVWAGLAAAALGVLAYILSAPARGRKREYKELVKLFDYYGKKFDEEEEGIDY